jgi:hypothetical protein
MVREPILRDPDNAIEKPKFFDESPETGDERPSPQSKRVPPFIASTVRLSGIPQGLTASRFALPPAPC